MINLNSIIGAIAGAAAMFTVLWVYNVVIDNPTVRGLERATVTAEGIRKTTEAINELSSSADKARAMRSYCKSVGRVYNFATNNCDEGKPN